MTIGIRQRGRHGPDPRALRSSLIALASTVVVFGGLGWIIVHAPGWPQVVTNGAEHGVVGPRPRPGCTGLLKVAL